MAIVVRSLAATYYGGHHIEPHAHPWGQLVYAVTGVMRVSLQDTFWIVPPARAVWAPPGVPHEIHAQGNYSMRRIYVAPQLSDRLPSAGAALQVTPLLRELVLRIIRIGMLDDTQRLHDGLVQVLLDELAQAQSLLVSLVLPRDRRALAVVERLRTDPSNRLELAQIAEGCGASTRTLQRLFRDETGLRFTEWRRRLRLLHAMELLSDGASVTVAGVEAGYESTSAFVAAFRREMGFTPAKCRGRPDN
jgi:AraC-like DNA-binding protein